MNLKEIKEMISIMNEHGILEFQLERDGFKVILKKAHSGGDVSIQSSSAIPLPPQAHGAPVPTIPVAEVGVIEITSPMVGTFYRSSSPDAESYVKKGQEVSVDDVVCIIEAMKVMNEIKSEIKGIILDILVENGEAVEFGQPLFKLKKI
jgi:acetyl-CoA carboxylase biotin carboxyl carrier protein